MRTVLCQGVLILLLAAGCSNERWLKSGDYYADKGLYAKAVGYYQKYHDAATTDDRRAHALLAMGRTLARWGQCGRSLERYEQAARLDPLGPASMQAQQEILSCRDYFPFKPKRWEEGDSQSGGRHVFCVVEGVKQPGSYLVRRKLFAGVKSSHLVQEILLIYSKEPGMLWERPAIANGGHSPTLILKFPYDVGAAWTTMREGRHIRRQIARAGLKVKVAAGVFEDCLEVAEEYKDAGNENRGRMIETYCPGAGRILTSIGDDKQIQRHIETLRIHDDSANAK